MTPISFFVLSSTFPQSAFCFSVPSFTITMSPSSFAQALSFDRKSMLNNSASTAIASKHICLECFGFTRCP
jgi:hypothetical protein